MLLIPLVVFLAVFASFVLLMAAARGRLTSRETARATLDSVLSKTPRPASEKVIDLRKNVALSAIPFFDRLLSRIRVATELRRILEQADLRWTPGRVLLTGVAAWLVALYAIQLKTDTLALSALLA